MVASKDLDDLSVVSIDITYPLIGVSYWLYTDHTLSDYLYDRTICC